MNSVTLFNTKVLNSVLDIVCDMNLFFDYLLGEEDLTEYVMSNDTIAMEDQTNRILGNITIRSCTIINTSCSEEGLKISCKKNDPWFAILTLFFIYLPCVNVIGTLYGPKKAGMVGIVEAIFILIVGGLLGYIGYSLPSPVAAIMGWFMIILGLAVLGLGLCTCLFVFGFSRPSVLHFCLFIPLMILSPPIFIFTKLLAVFEAKNKFIQSQSTYGSRGEAILEAAPQLCLQVSAAMLTMDPSFNQIFSIITSVATLSLPNIENYVTARGKEFGFDSIIKNIAVFLPASLFKVLSFSIICVFFRAYTFGFVIGFVALYWLLLLYFRVCRYNMMKDFMKSEYVVLHWLTLGSLGTSKMDAILRSWFTLLFTIIYTIILLAILVVCYMDPEKGSVQLPVLGMEYTWSDLEMVKDPFFLNLILYSTIGLGWTTLFLDILSAWCRLKDSSDDETINIILGRTVLLKALKFNTKNINTLS